MKSNRTKNRRLFPAGALIVILLLACAALAQSGRRKDPSKPAKPNAGTTTQQSRPARTETEGPEESAPSNARSNEVPQNLDGTDVVRVSSSLVPIPASVIDPNGFALTTLKMDDFELRVDGQVKAISELTRSETPVRMAMLFDNSGSLDFAREFEKRAAIHFFRRVLHAKDEAAIYSVETESYLAQPLTADVKILEQTIANFGKPEGSTSLFDAVIDAATYLRPYVGRRVLVIVSDGVETTSRADFETTMQRVLADDCQIFIVQTGLYDGANLRALAAERRMQDLAGETGGAVFIPKTTSDLDNAFDQISADLAQQYVLSYYPAEAQRDGRYHQIELKVKARKDVRIRTRKGYYSPKPSNLAERNW